MKVIVAGSRTFDNYILLEEVLNKHAITEVVSGTARGADSMGELWAEQNNIPIKRFPANWSRFGRSAGFIRNEEMADYAEALIAFWDGRSRGTKHMIDLAEREGLTVEIISI